MTPAKIQASSAIQCLHLGLLTCFTAHKWIVCGHYPLSDSLVCELLTSTLIGVLVNSATKRNREREISDGLKYSSQLVIQSSKSLYKAQNVGAAEELGFGQNLLIHCQIWSCLGVGVCRQGCVWVSCYLGCELFSPEDWTHLYTWVTWGWCEEVDSQLPCLWFGTFCFG